MGLAGIDSDIRVAIVIADMNGQDFCFSIPEERHAGFLAVVEESNAVARACGINEITIQESAPVDGMIPMFVPCDDRTQMLSQELLGFLTDADEGRPFQRTRHSEKHW